MRLSVISLFRVSKWAGLCIYTSSKFLVELIESITIISYHAELIYEVSSIFLFLYLLVHKPVKTTLKSKVFFLYCHSH